MWRLMHRRDTRPGSPGDGETVGEFRTRLVLLRLRFMLLVAVAVLAAVPLAAVTLGVRLTGARSGSVAGPPLIRPPFGSAPRLGLGVLAAGPMPNALTDVWRRTAADGRVEMAELVGVPVVVNFWASWCLPCRREAPLLERVWREQAGRVLVLGVNQNDALNDARSFLRRFRIAYPSVTEPGDATARRWRVGAFPVTFFLAVDGHVVAQTIGMLRPGQLERGITAARGDRLGQ
jgi:cytochrome c biogenesis protein CcmG/thiol:disulfide interchange protein DsbE